MLHIHGVFANDSIGSGTLCYELDVQRTGDAGTSRSTQSGGFDTPLGQTDTLSTVRINVQSGDQVDLHLIVRRDGALVDEVRRQRTF